MWARVLLNGQCLFIGTLLFILLQDQSLALDLALELGYGEEDTDRGGLALQWEWDKKWLATGNWYLGGYWEASFSYWDGEEGRSGTGSLAEAGFTPVFRVQSRDPLYGLWPYVEAAVGIHLMTEEELGDKDFSIPFAFASHGGAGVRFGPKGRLDLGYRYQHLSNAGLGDSNPGINFHLVRLAYHF